MMPDGTYSAPWGQHRFACCLSHDVDHLAKYRSPLHWARRGTADLFRRRDLPMALRRMRFDLRDSLAPRRYVEECRWLLRKECELGVTASYFFLTTGPTPEHGGYPIEQAADMVREVEEAGMEAGLHAGFDTYLDPARIREEKATLDSMVRNHSYGVRQHYLRLQIPDTWRIHADAGFLYDSSLYGARHAHGAAHGYLPFRPIDPEEGGEIGIWEMPLSVMDGTLVNEMGLDPAEGLSFIKLQIAGAEEAGGVFCLLWHNSSLDRIDWKGWRDVYLETLDFVLERNGWIASGREIIHRWGKG